LSHFDVARNHILAQLDALDSGRDKTVPDDYLSTALRLTQDLFAIGSQTTAWNRLASALHHATANDRVVSSVLHVQVATELGRMKAQDGLTESALRELVDIRQAASALADDMPAKAAFYQLLASTALRAGYNGDGVPAAEKAMKLLTKGIQNDSVAAELAEAKFLSGATPDPPSGVQT
jgi:hypothetical protein